MEGGAPAGAAGAAGAAGGWHRWPHLWAHSCKDVARCVVVEDCGALGGHGDLKKEGGVCTVTSAERVHGLKAENVEIAGKGSLVLEGATGFGPRCDAACKLYVRVGGRVALRNSTVRAGSIEIRAAEVSLLGSALDASGRGTGRAGAPPKREGGGPLFEGAGHGGDGASCDPHRKAGKAYGWGVFEDVVAPQAGWKSSKSNPGGDAFGGSAASCADGSKSAAAGGGGRILVQASETVVLVESAVHANGAACPDGFAGGGGSGGSVAIETPVFNVSGSDSWVTAVGGDGTGGGEVAAGGGAGGRIGISASRYLDANVEALALAYGGHSSDGCLSQQGGPSSTPSNGAPGTVFVGCRGCNGTDTYEGSLLLFNNQDESGVERTTGAISPLGGSQSALPKALEFLDHLAIRHSTLARLEVDYSTSFTNSWYFANFLEVSFGSDLELAMNSGPITDIPVRVGCLQIYEGSRLYSENNVHVSLPLQNLAEDVCAAHGFRLRTIQVNSDSSFFVNPEHADGTSRIEASEIVVMNDSSLKSSRKLQLSPPVSPVADPVVVVGQADASCSGATYYGRARASDDQSLIGAEQLWLSNILTVCIGEASSVQAPLGSTSSGCPAAAECSARDIKRGCDMHDTVFTLRFCNVQNIVSEGLIGGSAVLMSRVNWLNLTDTALVDTTGHGCTPNNGQAPGNLTVYDSHNIGSGAGHGGRGGNGTFSGLDVAEGGQVYDTTFLDCSLGSGGGSGGGRGGGTIVVGSHDQPVQNFYLAGTIKANGLPATGPGGGGGSGGSILVFARGIEAAGAASITAQGGDGGNIVDADGNSIGSGGGGGGGVIYMEWTGSQYEDSRAHGPVAVASDGGDNQYCPSASGGAGVVLGLPCKSGTAGVLCTECARGFYSKNPMWDVCKPCQAIPDHAEYAVASGGTEYPCAYRCARPSLDPVTCSWRIHHQSSMSEIVKVALSSWAIAIALGVLFMGIYSFVTGETISVRKKAEQRGQGRDAGMLTLFGDYVSSGIDSMITTPLNTDGTRTYTIHEVWNGMPYDQDTARIPLRGTGEPTSPWSIAPHETLTEELVYPREFQDFIEDCNFILAPKSRRTVQAYRAAKWLLPSVAAVWASHYRRRKAKKLSAFTQTQEAHMFFKSARIRALESSIHFDWSRDRTFAFLDVVLPGVDEGGDQKPPLVSPATGFGTYLYPYQLQNMERDRLQKVLVKLLGHARFIDIQVELNLLLYSVRSVAFWDTVPALLEYVQRVQKEIYMCDSHLRLGLCRIRDPTSPHPRLGLTLEYLEDEEVGASSALGPDVEAIRYEAVMKNEANEVSAQLFRALAYVQAANARKLSSAAVEKVSGIFLLIVLLFILDSSFTTLTLVVAAQDDGLFWATALLPVPFALLLAPIHLFNSLWSDVFRGKRRTLHLFRLFTLANCVSLASTLFCAVGVLVLTYGRSYAPFRGHQWRLFYPVMLLFFKLMETQVVDLYVASQHLVVGGLDDDAEEDEWGRASPGLLTD